MRLERDKICALKITWVAAKSCGVQIAIILAFSSSWVLVIKETGKQTLQHGKRKVFGYMSVVVRGYFTINVIAVNDKIGKNN